jgi:hypothetical protein
MKLAGTAAQFGRGVVDDVSQKLMAEFADRLADEIRHPSERAAAAPADEERPARDDDVLDLTVAGRDAVLRRVVPAAAGLAALLVLLGAVRGGRKPRRAPLLVIDGPLVVIGGRPRRRRRRRS